MRPNRLAAAGVLLATGVGLLATAALAADRHVPPGIKDGGTLRLNVSATDVQSIDPALDYEFIGWQLEYATCLKLMNYPDLAGAAGNVLDAGGRGRLPDGVRGRKDLHLHHPAAASSSTPVSRSPPRRSPPCSIAT